MTLAELLRELNIETAPASHHHRNEGWEQINCPYCTGAGSQKFYMGVHQQRLYCNCWICGAKPLAQVLAEASFLPYPEIKRLIARIEASSGLGSELIARKGVLKIPPGAGPLTPAHRRYLERRGINPKEATTLWGARGYGNASHGYYWRILIPITLYGETVSFTTRTISDGSLRYLNAKPEEEALPAKQVLYGADLARNTITIHEGPLDCWRVGPGATCTMGLGWSRAQFLRMTEFPKRIVCFDNEPTAQFRAKSLMSELSSFEGETYNVCLDAKDAGEASDKEINQLRRMLR